jgi:uncharacterized membrane protein
VSEAEVERLFRAIEELRRDVAAYRNDLHDLEMKLVEMEAREDQRSMSKSQVYRLVFAAAAIISTTTAVATQIISKI